MFGLLNGVVNAVKNIFGGQAKAAPKPAAPKPVTSKPAPSPISQVISGVQNFVSNPLRAVSQQSWLPKPVTNWAALAAAEEQRRREAEAARLAAERERARRQMQAQVDAQKQQKQQQFKQTADNIMNWFKSKDVKYNGDWRSLLDDNGSFKGQNTGGGLVGWGVKTAQNWFDPDVGRAKSDYSKWLDSTPEGQQKKAQKEFEATKEEYRQRAEQIISNTEKANKGGLLDWFTGSSKDNARALAQKQLEDLQKNQTARYDSKLNDFLKQQAAKKAEIEGKKFTTQAEFDKAVKEFSNWENQGISDLEYTRAASAGMAEGYGKKSQEQNTSPLGTAGSWFNKNVVNGFPGQVVGGIWKYTLGSGDENMPSVVTAPSRVINWLGNSTFNKDGEKNLHGGQTIKGIEQGKNAWTQTLNQRNFNMEQPKKATTQDFESWYKTRDLSQWKDDIKAGRIKEEKVKDLFRQTYNSQIDADKWANYATEFMADPLSLAGFTKTGSIVGKGSKAAGWATKGADALKATKVGGEFWNAAEKVAKSKPVQWLGKEYKTPDQTFSDALKSAKAGTSELNKTLGARINAVNQKLAGKDKIDIKILDDLKGLSDHEAAIVQRMVDGKFGTFRDRLAMKDIRGLQYAAPQREKLLDIAKRWTDFTEKMKLSDEVTKTGFGAGKRTYAPWVDFTGDHSADTYNFFARKKMKNRVQTADDFSRNAETRYLKSNLGGDLRAEANATRTGWTNQRSRMQAEYDARFKALTEPVRAADAKRGTLSRYVKQRAAGVDPTTSLGRSMWNTARNTAGLPTKVWKQSVLKYRPAWTVNNVLYNTQAAGLAGGGRALLEQAKMVRPKNWRKAMDEVPALVKADLTGEIGKGKLNKFYNGVENWSRVAAFRGAKAKGLSDAESLKRVDKYLFNYKTKNYERPLKAVMPFYAWNKNLAKATAQMPFDRPFAAKGYHQLDQYQQNQFDAEFEKTVPELTRLGYSEEEIQKIKDDQAKYYKGRLKVGNQWITTPFNAFSEKGLTGLGFNPYAAALGESATATDSFGRPIGGEDAKLSKRIASKFPQYELGNKALKSWRVANGVDKPTKGWIGEKGSEGYGLSKERQGYDSSKSNYDRSMDPRAKLAQDALAFVGVPRGIEFDINKLVDAKKLQKMSDEYFSLDTKSMDYPAAEAAREAVFKKYGMTADDFYKGVLSKYDTDNTKRIKGMKEQAATSNKSLFQEYAVQPAGTRNMWATEKLRELNKQGYFDNNPFLKSFDWVNPSSVAKADRQATYLEAKKTGDFSSWRAKYGDTRKVSAKKIAYEKAKASGDWNAYHKSYGTTPNQTPYQHDGKFFKSAESMQKYKDGQFWAKYASADKTDRKKLLVDNPQYNQRANWTDEMWNTWKSDAKRKQVAKSRAWGNFAATQDANKAEAQRKAKVFLSARTAGRPKKLTWG